MSQIKKKAITDEISRDTTNVKNIAKHIVTKNN